MSQPGFVDSDRGRAHVLLTFLTLLWFPRATRRTTTSDVVGVIRVTSKVIKPKMTLKSAYNTITPETLARSGLFMPNVNTSRSLLPHSIPRFGYFLLPEDTSPQRFSRCFQAKPIGKEPSASALSFQFLLSMLSSPSFVKLADCVCSRSSSATRVFAKFYPGSTFY